MGATIEPAGVAGGKVPAADQVLRILAHLAAQRGPAPAATIATALGLPRSTTYQLLAVLVERGFVVHLPEERRYGLGVGAFELSSGFSRQQPLTRLGRLLVAALVDRLGESAHLAVLHGRDVLYLVEERAPRRPSLVSDVGVRLPAHLTATGRAMLAAVPAAQLRALYPDRGAFTTSDWSYGRLKSVLAGVRAAGIATEDDEVTVGLSSIGSVVVDHLGWPAAAVAVTFPAAAGVDRAAVEAAVRETASRLSGRIGGPHSTIR